jgi:ubiquinone/menaquinone biosynthesis C-methylase UbiE
MSLRIMLIDWCLISLFWTVIPALAQEHHKGHSAAELNKQFQDPHLDISRFVDRFETDSREIFAQRRKIVEAVGLHPGQAVADIGAGTGLFSWMFAEKVGPKGTVYAVEIAPAFLKFLGEQAHKRALEMVVKPVRSTQDTTNLAPGSIDLAFVCATYHHFEHPEEVLASTHRSLRPGGRLVVIDFDLRKDSSEFVRERARAPKEVYFREIEAAGFVPINAKPSLVFKESFFAAFQRLQPDTQHNPGSRKRVDNEVRG